MFLIRSGKFNKSIPFYHQMSIKFLLILILISFIPLTALYFFSSQSVSEMLVESLKNDLKEKSFLVGADIDRFFKQRVHDVKILSQADVLESNNIPAIIQYLTEVILETDYIDAIDIIDNNGIIIASSGDQHEKGKHVLSTRHPILQNLIEKVQNAQQGDIFVSGVMELDSGPGIALLTPIIDDTNTIVIKTLLAEINLDVIKKIVSDFDARVIGDKYVYIVNNEGHVIVTSDPDIGVLEKFPDLSMQPQLVEVFSKKGQGGVGSIIYTDAKGTPVMAEFADMAEFGLNKAMDWSIIAVAPLSDITMPVQKFKKFLLILSLSIFVFSAFCMYLMTRKVLGSIQKLVMGAQKVGSGDFDYRLPEGTKDEFGYLTKILNQTLDNLVQAQKGAQQANIVKSNFLAAMSHEIRTPMSIIVGLSELLCDSKLPQQQKEWGESIKSSSESLLIILNEILDQSKLEVGMMQIITEDFNLYSLISEEVKLFLPKMSSKGLSLTSEIEESVPEYMHGDRMRIGQIISNFLSNAYKFTSYGTVALSVTKKLVGGKELIEISVKDTGVGISEDFQQTLFTAFTQVDNSVSRGYGGTGLGLSISKQLAELMDGEIGVESIKGLGSRFWFTFAYKPAVEMQEEEEEEDTTVNWIASRSLDILLVEDTPALQELGMVILRKYHHHIKCAENGKVAIEMLKNNKFDIVLMDIRMPVMDGFEATRIIRGMKGNFSQIPIVAVTADVSESNKKLYEELHIDGCCYKPIVISELLKAINNALNEEVHKRF